MPPYVNKFEAPQHRTEVILDREDQMVGTIRIKPSGVLWKPVNAQSYYRVSLQNFIDWITDPNTGATRPGA